MSDPKKLYQSLNSGGLYTKSYDDFKSQFSTPEAQAKLHSTLYDKGLYTKSVEEFGNQFFAAEKKKILESLSISEKPATSSVAKLRPTDGFLASSPSEKPPEVIVEPSKTEQGSEGKLLIPEKPFYEFKLPPPSAKTETPKAVAKKVLPTTTEVTQGSEGKLLIPEKQTTFPAVTETVTKFKKVEGASSKFTDKNLPLDPALMLQAIGRNEGGQTGQITKIKGNITNTASGKYQITEGTLESIYNQSKDFKDAFSNFNSFKKEYNKNPSLEYSAALEHMSDLITRFGKYALAAWYSPDHAGRAAQGNIKALNEVPRRDAGNRISVKSYYNNALNYYKKILGDTNKGSKMVETSETIVKEPEVTLPSMDKFHPEKVGEFKTETPIVNQESEVGVIDDLWNTFKGAGVKALASLVSIPKFAQTAALDITMSAIGLESDFNKLPSSAKKEIRNALTNANVLNAPMLNYSEKANDFLNKKSEDIYKKTRQEEIDVVDELNKFRKNPSAESINKILYQGLKTTIESVPYMAIGMASLPAMGVAVASAKREEDLVKSGGESGLGYLLNAGVTGAAETIFEGTTNKILKRAALSAFGKKELAEKVAIGFLQSVVKDFGKEGASEGATTFIQELSDKITKGEEINWWKLGKQVANSTVLGGLSGAGITASAQTIGASRRYVANKIMPKDQKEKIQNNINTIQSLNLEHGDDVDPKINEVVNKKIEDLIKENEDIMLQNETVASNLSSDQVQEVFNIDDQLDNNYDKAKSIIDNESMDENAKKLLLDDLLKEQNTLKQQKDAIQKQTTSEVPVQPEAGGSLQMAEGEPQAKPQTPAQEVKPTEPKVEIIGERVNNSAYSIADGKIYFNMPTGEKVEVSPSEGVDVMAVIEADIARSKNEMLDALEQDKPNITEQEYNTQLQDIDAKYAKELADIKPVEQVSVEQKNAEQANAVQKGIDAVNKALRRGRPRKEGIEGGISFMQKTIAYEQADDVTREQMVRDIRKQFGTKEKKAPSVKKILGANKVTKVTVDEMTALKDQIKLEVKVAKGAEKATDNIRKSVVEKIKSFITRGSLSATQQKNLLNGLSRTNILNPIMRERLFERMNKMFQRADYQDRIKEANKYKSQIKKLAKSPTIQASVSNMAKNFGKVIPDFTNIDEYLQKAREVYNAIKTPKSINEELQTRVAAIIDDVNAYTKKQLKAQEERLKNTLLDQYDNLVEQGLINKDMSLKEIQDYILSMEKEQAIPSEEKEVVIREQLEVFIADLVDTAKSILDGYNPLTGEDVELDSYTKSLIDRFTKMDLSLLSVTQLYRASEALDNFIVNGIADNMEAIYKLYEGALEAKKLSKSGIVAQNLKRFGLLGQNNIFAQSWAINISPIKSVLDLMFRSREIGSKIFQAAGLRDISNQASKAKNEVTKIDEAYANRFSKTKPNNQAFNTAKNSFERGIFGHLSRSFNGTEKEIENEFDRRKKNIEGTIKKLMESGDKKSIKKAEVLNEIFDKIKDATNISEVAVHIDPINQSAVKWWNGIFDKYYPEVKQIAASVYNTILEDDINYSPDIYEKIIEDGTPDIDPNKSTFKMSFNFLNAEKSGTLMKNNRLPLPKDRVINFDFDYNNSQSLAKMLTDVRTAPAVQQYKGFSSSASFEKIFPNLSDRNVIKERMNWYVNEVRHKNVVASSSRAKDAEKIFRSLSRYGTARALGSVTSFIKQSSTAALNTMINLATNPKAFAKGIATIVNPDAQNFINNSGYGIANRGLESQTSIESADKILEQTDFNSVNKIAELTAKSGKIYLNYFLKNGDIIAARASWMAYYMDKLDKMGENTSNIDWKNHKLNKEAADYAEDKINLQQNVSDTAMMGKLLNTKNPYVSIARSTLIPFSSFIFNAKDKISTDLTILTSNANKTEKINAIKSLAGTAAEMALFELLSASISNLVVMSAYSILGYDDDEDEKQKREDNFLKMAATRIYTDVLSPIPNWGDKALVGFTNMILESTQRDVEEEDKKLLYEYKPQDQLDAILGLIGGIPQLAAQPIINISSTANKILSDSYYDKYGNEIILSDEDKDKLKFVLAVEVLSATNALPNEVQRVNQKVEQLIEKNAR